MPSSEPEHEDGGERITWTTSTGLQNCTDMSAGGAWKKAYRLPLPSPAGLIGLAAGTGISAIG